MSIEQRLLDQMRDLHQRMHRLFNDRMRAQGSSLARLKVLALVDQAGSIRSTDIAEALGQAPRTVTEAIDAIESEGLAVRRPDPDDRRAKRISLTAAGQAVVRAAAPHRDAFAAEIFSALSVKDMEDYLKILTILNDRIIEMGAPGS